MKLLMDMGLGPQHEKSLTLDVSVILGQKNEVAHGHGLWC